MRTIVVIITFSLFFIWATQPIFARETLPWWRFQSIDTMKYSRDTAGQKLTDSSFDTVIDEQIKQIADTGATHVAIATPYDERFVPFLARWVEAARRYKLHVWFRGNFSGWEEWFGYQHIGRDEHKRLLKEFLQKHPELFEDGDAFSSCPECENGGAGDPRQTGDIEGHRQFLIDEYVIARQAFYRMGKNVIPNLHSMNGDIAKLIMDEDTTRALGGYVVIDHYVDTPEKLVTDAREIAEKSKGNIIFGEFGAPIPDIHGNMTEDQQAKWVDEALTKLALEKEVIGVSYWVNYGGSTRLWNDDGSKRKVVDVLTQHFTPPAVYGKVVTQRGRPISNATVKTAYRIATTDKNGIFNLALAADDQPTVAVFANGYISETVPVDAKGQQNVVIALESDRSTLLQKIWGWIVDRFAF